MLHFNSVFWNKCSFSLNLCTSVLRFYAVNLPSIPQNTSLEIRTKADLLYGKVCCHSGKYGLGEAHGVLCQTLCPIFSSAYSHDRHQRPGGIGVRQENTRIASTSSIFLSPSYCWLGSGKREAALVGEGLPRESTFLKS